MDSRETNRTAAGRAGPHTWRFVVALVLAGGLVAAILVAVFAPRPLAEHLAAAWLKSQGADSALRVTSLTGRGLSASVRLGDPADPDLVIDRVDVTYAVSGPWNGKALDVTPLTVRLIRPRLRLAVKNGALDYGQLAGVVKWARSLPPSTRPLPDVVVEDGGARLVTDTGVLVFTGGGRYAAAGPTSFAARLAPFHQSSASLNAAGPGGTLTVQRQGSRLVGGIELGPTHLETAAGSADLTTLALRAAAPFPALSDRLAGPVRVTIDVQGAGGVAKAKVDAVTLRLVLDGTIDATAARQTFTGAITSDLDAGRLAAVGGSLTGAQLRSRLTSVSLTHAGNDVAVLARGVVSLSLARLDTPKVHVADLTLDATVTDGAAAARKGVASGRLSLSGRGGGTGGLAPATIAQLVKGIPEVSGERPYAAALATALKAGRLTAPDWRLAIDDKGARLALPAPLRLQANSGAAMTLQGQAALSLGPSNWRGRGGAVLGLSGGGLPTLALRTDDVTVSAAGLSATVTGGVDADLAAARGAKAAFHGRVSLTSAGLRADLLDCATFAARSVGAPDPVAQAIVLRLCPSAGPLLDASAKGWRGVGRLEGVGGESPALGVGLRDAALTFAGEGGAKGVNAATVKVTAARLVDTTDAPRFNPLDITGDLTNTAGAWRGVFAVEDPKHRPLGQARLAQDAAGVGRMDRDPGPLIVAAAGLQPTDLSPLAAVARAASGAARFTGWFAWTPGAAMTSGGELSADRFGFAGPSGAVANLNTHIAFTSLTPLITAPGQRLTVGSIDSVTPFTDLEVVFTIGSESVTVSQLAGKFAGGTVSLDPVVVAFAEGGAFESALVLHKVNIGQVLAASNLSDKVKMTAVVDGRIPFGVGKAGVNVKHGVLDAIGGGRLTIVREAFDTAKPAAGAPATPAAQTSFAQDFAYQAMENLSFDSLDATLGSLAHDRLGVIFHIKGRHDPPVRQRAVFRVADLLAGKAFGKPVPLPSGTKIDLTLDTSLNFGELIDALTTAWQDAIRPRGAAHPASAAPGRSPTATKDPAHP